tara:strand:+ start:576 stop:1112 length:537 start_codon:yes stop_codon:yes gene_type:complete
MNIKSNIYFFKQLKREIKINSESWKRQVTIISYRIKFYFTYVKSNKLGLFFAKSLSILLDFFSQSRSIPGKIFIGYGLNIPHGFHNVFITEKAVLGNNITLFHNVTIGISNIEDKSQTKIKVGDNVIIGTGSTILGKCNIGNHVRIGANSFLVNQNIENHCTVLAQRSNKIISDLIIK